MAGSKATRPDARDNKGARLLRAWAKKHGHDESFVALGKALDRPWHRCRRWYLGENTPGAMDVVMLKEKCGIPEGAWFEKARAAA